MREDQHLGTGAYDPEKYWSARAEHSGGDCFNAVCVYGVPESENRHADRVQRALITAALRHIDLKDKNVLEYGCGIGRWLPFFHQYGCRWSGVDISQKMLELAAKRVPSIDFRKIEDLRIPHEDGQFDLVYTVTVLHHNYYEAQQRIVAEMARVCRPGGHVIFFEGLGNASQFNMFPRSKSEWIKLAEEHGMTCVWQRGARYRLLRDVAFKLQRLVRPAAAPAEQSETKPRACRKLVGRLELMFDHLLVPLLPDKYQTTALMLFRTRNR
jgi:SAM-dependent methyltransferase